MKTFSQEDISSGFNPFQTNGTCFQGDMNPQYGGTPFQPLGAQGPPHSIPTYSQQPPPDSYNGYESHSVPGFNQLPQGSSKTFTHPVYGAGNPPLQNGPASRPVNQLAMGVPVSSQGFPQKLHPNVPSSIPPRGIMPDQLAHQVNDMHISQSQTNLPYLPMSGSSTQQRLVRPNMPLYPPSQQGVTRPTYQPLSFSTSASSHYGPPAGSPSGSFGSPMQYSSGYVPSASPPVSAGVPSYSLPDGTVTSMGSASVPSSHSQPQMMPSSGHYSCQPIGPPIPETSGGTSVNQPPPNACIGAFPPGNQPPVSGMTAAGPLPPTSHANGPVSAPSVGQYAQHSSMQARYPQVTQPPNTNHGIGQQPPFQPPPFQPGVGQASSGPPQNRMGAPLAPQPAPQSRRLDPDQMPSPIQVIEDDRKLRNGSFYTNTRGQVPPLVTSSFTVNDEGMCNPRFIRSTIYSVPCTAEMLKQTSVPFALTISPFAQLHEEERPPPIAENIGDSGPVRCNRCKAYMCPFMQFIDGGRRFQCVFCKGTSEVPPEYFTHLDHLGQRTDKFQRPELCLGSYEFVATKDYCKNGYFPKSPAFIFMIDVSYNSVRNGMVKLLCENMKHVLSNLPREMDDEPSNIRVGFVTYSNVVHFYNVKGNLAQPQMLVVSDVQDMFMPLLDGFLVLLSEAEQVVDSLMEQIPIMFADTRETETVLGPVIQAGLEALKAADCAGKLFIFHSTLPIAEAPGKLKNRDDRKLLATDKEKQILCPQNTFYNNLGQECVSVGCCVDLFLFPNAYIDIATLGQVCRLSGGQMYKYTYFQADIDGTRFLEDLKRDVEKPIAFDAIIRVRTSTGIRPTEFYGNYFMSNTTDIELATIDCDKAIAVEIKYDDKLVEEDGAYIQAAVLFTSCSGQRRLRIHNLALNTCSQMADLFRNCELDTIMNVFSKEAVRLITEQTPRQVKDHFITRSAQILACYRKNCANPSSAGQLILPECMKLLPLYINCLIKSDAVAGGQEMSTDDRSFVMLAVNSMDVESSACYLYPQLLPLHEVDPDSNNFPTAIRCSIEKIKDYGVYLIDNGIFMYLWIGMAVSPEWIQNVFAVQTVARIDIDKTTLLDLNTPLSKRVREIISQVRKERQRHMKLLIVRQGDKLEMLFRQLLVEDRTTEGSASYVDFLCHLHKEIRSLLT